MVYTTYRARKPMDIGDTKRQPGELVPEAQTWFRVQHLVHSGHLVPEVVEDDDFEKAVRQFCPELSDQLIGSEMEKKMATDKAAQDAFEANQRMAANPRTELEQRHAAPPSNPEDPSNSDVAAKAALDAAAVTEQWEKENQEKTEKDLEAAKAAQKDSDRGVKPGKPVDLDKAHEAFVSDALDLDDDAKARKADQAKAPEVASAEAVEKDEQDDSQDGEDVQSRPAAKKTAPAKK